MGGGVNSPYYNATYTKYMFCFSYWFYLYYFSQRPVCCVCGREGGGGGEGSARTDPKFVNDKMATSHNFQVNRIPDITVKEYVVWVVVKKKIYYQLYLIIHKMSFGSESLKAQDLINSFYWWPALLIW